MKTNIKILVISGFAMLAVFTSCQKEMLNSNNGHYASVLDVSTDGTTAFISPNMQSALVETSSLTETEVVSLLKMKEEEKLARDVYSALYQKWGSHEFSRIKTAENNHLNAIINLLKYYGVSDSLIEETGIFTDSNVQALYGDLVSQSLSSVEDGYKTGALIEEMDIKDLKESIGQTSNPNIIMVFENLERGSRNHLRAFSNMLSGLGIVYTPIYLTQTEYGQITNSAMEKGKQYKMNGKGNGKDSCNGSGQGKRNGMN